MNVPIAEDIVFNTLSRLTDIDLATLLLIRRFEEALLDLFANGKVSGTTHTCLGQEYVPVALAPLLHGDMVMSNHRGHGHYLAHCADPEGLLAEILGRAGAPCLVCVTDVLTARHAGRNLYWCPRCQQRPVV